MILTCGSTFDTLRGCCYKQRVEEIQMTWVSTYAGHTLDHPIPAHQKIHPPRNERISGSVNAMRNFTLQVMKTKGVANQS